MIWCVAVNVMFIEKQCWTDEMFSEQSIEECWWLTYWAVLMLWRRTAPNHCLQYVFVFHVLCVFEMNCCWLCEDWERWLPEEVCWNLRAVMRSGAVSPISRRTNQPFRWSFLECWKHRDLEFCLSLVYCGGSIVVSQPAVSAVVCSCVGHYARVELCVVEFCASKAWSFSPGRCPSWGRACVCCYCVPWPTAIKRYKLLYGVMMKTAVMLRVSWAGLLRVWRNTANRLCATTHATAQVMDVCASCPPSLRWLRRWCKSCNQQVLWSEE